MKRANRMRLMVTNEFIDSDMVHIDYTFHMGEDRKEVFNLCFDAETLEMIIPNSTCLPSWTDLNFKQCHHCQMDCQTSPKCPVAANLALIINRFNDVRSYDEIDLEVATTERNVRQHTTVQRGLGAILGLMFATSGCTHTNFLKPMARFHLPLASSGETLFRAVGSYLIGQYFENTAGHECTLGLAGLYKSYQNMHELNRAIADRISHATNQDGPLNAVTLLDVFANLMPMVLENQLNDLKHLWPNAECALEA